jgi:hypothetical protein
MNNEDNSSGIESVIKYSEQSQDNKKNRQQQIREKYGLSQKNKDSSRVGEQVSDDSALNSDCIKETLENERENGRENSKLYKPPFPSGLQLRETKLYLVAGAATIATTVLIVNYKTIQCLMGYVLAGVLVYLALSVRADYYEGKISELCLICASVTQRHVRNTTQVMFRTQEDLPKYYEFIVPGNNQTNFKANQVYLVYFREENPKQLLGHTQM